MSSPRVTLRRMPDIELFNFENVPVRTVLDVRGEPWFYARDVCNVLEIRQVKSVLDALDEDEVSDVNGLSTPVQLPRSAGRPEALVSESGLYAIVLRSRKPQARRFRKWLTSDVIPALRRTGTYTVPAAVEPEQSMGVVPSNDADLELISKIVDAIREDRQAIRELRADVDHVAAVSAEALGGVEEVQEGLIEVQARVVDLHQEMRERAEWLTANEWMMQEQKPHRGPKTNNMLSARATRVGDALGLRVRKRVIAEYSYNTWPSHVWTRAWTELCADLGWAM
jgi:prophage antirepressor-like protein